MVWQVFGANTPRFVRPVGGLAVEGQRTNHFANPRGEGAVVGVLGAGGVWPTGWGSGSVFSGLALEILGQGVDNGMSYTRFRLFGTSDGGVSRSTGSYSAPAALGQIITNSVFSRLVSGSVAGLSVQIEAREYAGSSPGGVNGVAISLAAAWSRTSVTRTMLDPATTSCRYTTRFTATNSVAYDVVFDLAWPSIEDAPFASTPILPPVGTLAAATRGADIVTAPFATLFPNNELSLLIAASIGQVAPQTSRQTLIQVDAGTDADGWAVLNEPARTNLVRNPRAAGAVLGVVGAGGALPTHWDIRVATNTVVTVVGTGSEAGVDYVDVKLDVNGTHALALMFEAPSGMALTPGASYATSLFARVTAGSWTGFANATLTIRRDAPASAANVGITSLLTATSAALNTQRFVGIVTDAGWTSGRLQIIFNGTADGSITLRLGWPSCELGAFATSPILPPIGAPGAASRAADTITLVSGGVAANLGTFTPGALFKVGVTLGGGQVKALLDGGSLMSLPAPSTPPTTVRHGNNADGSRALFGEIRRTRALAFALPDAAVQPALTALPILP